jgi:acetyl esterase/lipase
MAPKIVWLAAAVTFFLSLWIVLPGPNLFFLRLAVGAPEISPLLGMISLILLALTLFRRTAPRKVMRGSSRRLTALLIATLVLSSLPLLQQPRAVAQAERSMAIAFPSSRSKTSSSSSEQSAASYPPFSWLNFIRGIPGVSQSELRYRPHIPFAAPSNSDQPLVLDLYQPSAIGKYPAVITIYGGSWRQGSPAQSARMSQYLAARGYVVVAIDYRHAPQHHFPVQLEDVQSALAFVRDRTREYEIDGDRIALLGWSAGAHLALLAGFQAKQPVQAIVDYYGPVDLAAGYSDPPVPDPINSKQVLLDFLGGSPRELPAAYAAASPITYANSAAKLGKALPATLLIYGGRDHLVEARFGKRLYDALRRSETLAVWVKIPWAEHAFDKIFNGPSNQMALHFVERFLHETL